MNMIGKWGAMRVGAAAAVLLALGGCVYGPDYGYVRGDGYYGDAYYGDAGPAYSGYGGYYGYDYGYGYGPYGYGYGYGPSIGLGFYYDNYGHRHYGHGHGWDGHGWHGHNGHNGWAGGPYASGGAFRDVQPRGIGGPSGARSAPSAARGGSVSHGASFSGGRGGRSGH